MLTAHAEGAQVYECKAGADGKPAWTFREPIATLLVDGKTVGRHYAGPSWEHSDGSAVVGKVAGSAPGIAANDIAWLKLEVVSRRGNGVLAPASRPCSGSIPAAASSMAHATGPVRSAARPTPRIMCSCARGELAHALHGDRAFQGA